MPLIVDRQAQETHGLIIRGLRTARTEAGLSQPAAAASLPFRGRAISEWENGLVEPKLRHLILLADRLDLRLTLVDRYRQPVPSALWQRPGEEWVVFQRRRLATLLRHRRVALGLATSRVGDLVGVSRDSIQRWELVRVPPRPIAHVVWAQRLGYTLVLASAT